jgi:outer membrane protein assembly factor BamB
VVLAILLLLARFVLPVISPEATVYGVIGGVIGGLAIILWWLFFSRARWSERLGAVALMIVALFATSRIVHESISAGAMGMLFFILAIPVVTSAFVAWAVASRRLPDGLRRATMVATILLACGAWTLIRTGGFTADMDNDFAWRWTPTPEERLLAQAGDEPVAVVSGDGAVPIAVDIPAAVDLPDIPAAPEEPAVAKIGDEPATAVSGDRAAPAAAETAETGDWPGFRGPERDGVVHGSRIATDWAASPPVELWRRPIGPGWSSFAVHGNLVYTQEQRGDDEVVSCYNMVTGEPVWRHRDAARFWESNAGAGPRGTPTLSNGRVYTLGATGILNVLDADDGAVVWSRNPATDTGTELPDWGFSSSPLVVGDVVMVAASGKLAAYDLATGAPRWVGPTPSGSGYSSPHLLTIDGVPQVLLLSGAGATSVTPADGKLLWEHPWKGVPIVQPAVTADGDVLISVDDRGGVRRLAVAHGPGGWTVKERWTSIGLKPYFNDFVVHEGHAFGFDGSYLACMDVEDGKRKWKGGRYGRGQLVLLPDQDLLLVLSEQGELALVRATTDQFTELARIPAIEGKTWNHPVLAGDILLVRNSEEMAAFRLARAGD